MGQRDVSLPAHYLRDLEALLDEPLALTLPVEALAFAAKRVFARGLEPRQAAVLICHDHSRRLCQKLVDDNEPASDLVEFAVANRIDACAELAGAMDQDLLDLLPDLPDLVRQPCFSAEFRDTVGHLANWHGIPEHRWSPPAVRASGWWARRRARQRDQDGVAHGRQAGAGGRAVGSFFPAPPHRGAGAGGRPWPSWS